MPVYFWLCHEACRTLVPQPGIEPAPAALEAWHPNHWTAREVLIASFIKPGKEGTDRVNSMLVIVGSGLKSKIWL